VHSGKGGVVEQCLGITQAVGHEHPNTVLVATVALVLLFGGNRLLARAPWSLLVLIGGIVASQVFDLPGKGVATVGHVPAGLQAPVLPAVQLGDLEMLISGALAIAMVGLAEGLAAARLFAREHDDRVDTDQELIAHGAADLAAGLIGGMGAAGSLSKTATAERAGGRSQVVGIVAAVSVVLVLLFASGPMSALPAAVLAAIVVHAVWGLLKPRVFGEYWRIRSNDGIAAVVAMVGVLVLGPLLGLLAAVAQSLLGLVYRTTQVHIDEMGKLPEEKAAWGSLTGHPERHTVPGILVLRLDAPLFWANAGTVFDRLLETILARPDVRVVLLDLEATNQLDATTERRLESFLDTLRSRDKELYLVRVFHQVRVVMKASGFFDRLGEGRAWHSISAGVQAAKSVVAVQQAFEAAEHAWMGSDAVGPEGPEASEVDHEEWIAPRRTHHGVARGWPHGAVADPVPGAPHDGTLRDEALHEVIGGGGVSESATSGVVAGLPRQRKPSSRGGEQGHKPGGKDHRKNSGKSGGKARGKNTGKSGVEVLGASGKRRR
jgi:MFS superfamily sulfate permease-like transporter